MTITYQGPIFCLLLGVSPDYAQPITGQVSEVTCPVIGQAQPELTPSKRQKMGPGYPGLLLPYRVLHDWYGALVLTRISRKILNYTLFPNDM